MFLRASRARSEEHGLLSPEQVFARFRVPGRLIPPEWCRSKPLALESLQRITPALGQAVACGSIRVGADIAV